MKWIVERLTCLFKGHVWANWMYSHADNGLYRECFRCGKWEHKAG